MVGSLLLPNGEYTKNQEESYKYLLEFHFPNCTATSAEEHNKQQFLFNGVANVELIDRIITTDRIKWAIDSFVPLKSPGLDNIFLAMLQHATEGVWEIMRRTFKKSLQLKAIPKSWR